MKLEKHTPNTTPLTEEDQKGLISKTVLNRETLNLVEAENIAKAKVYFATHKKKFKDLNYLLSLDGIKDVHKQMFGEVWSWAGQFRTHDTNIGIGFEQIPVAVKNILDNYKFQTKLIIKDAQNDDDIDLLAIKFHYEVVAVHPFPNGNGRHARQIADLLLRALDKKEFSWNESEIIKNSSARQKYINAIKEYEEDKSAENLSRLLKIARS